MATSPDATITLSAVDRTKAAFDSAKRGLREVGNQAETAQASLSGLTARFGILGAAIGAALAAGASLKGAIDTADQMDDLAEKTGIAVEELTALRYAGEVVGTPIEALATGIRKLSVNMAGAAGGGKEQAAAFKAIGVEFKNLDGSLRGSDAVLKDIADKFASFRDGPEKAALAIEIFGKSGADMIPILNQGSAGIEKLRKEATALGAVFGADLAKQAADFNDNLKRLSLSSEAVKISLAGNLIPALNDAATAMIEARKESAGFFATLLAGYRGLVTGGDQVKNDAELVKLTEQLLNAQNLLDQARSDKSGRFPKAYQAQIQAEIDKINEAIKTTMAYRRVLRGEGLGNAPTDTKPDKPPAPNVGGKGGATAAEASAYDQLNASIQKRIDLATAEQAEGKKLTEAQRVEIELLADIQARSGKLTEAERQRLTGRAALLKSILEASAATTRQRDVEARAAQDSLSFQEQMAQESADAFKVQEDARAKAIAGMDEYAERLAEDIELQALEARTIGATDEARALAIQNLRIEIEARRRLREINSDPFNFFTPEQKDQNAARIRSDAEAAKRLAAGRAAVDAVTRASQLELDAFKNSLASLDDIARNVFTNVFEDGAGTFKRLGQTLKASLLNLLYEATLRPYIFQVGAQVLGGNLSPLAQSTLASAGGASNLLGAGSNLIGASAFTQGVGAGFSQLTAGVGPSAFLRATTELASASMATALGQAVGYLGPIAIGIALLASLAKKGETRQGAGYSVVGGTATLGGGPSGGAINQTLETQLVQSTFDTINATLKDLGSKITVTAFEAGLESSGKGRGATFAGGTLSSGASFGQTYDPALYTQTLTPEQAATQFGDQLARAQLLALQAAADTLPAYVQRALSSLDIPNLDATKAQAAFEAIIDIPNALLREIGLTRDQLVQQFTAGLQSGDAAAAGKTVADQIVGGIRQKLLGEANGQIIDILNQGVVTPFLDTARAIAAQQVTIDALNLASSDAAIENAVRTAEAIGLVLNDPRVVQSLDNLQTKLAGAFGKAGSALNLAPAYLTPSITDPNFGTTAADLATTTGKDLAAERQTLQDRLDAATLTSIQLREKERAAIDATNRDLFDQVTAAERAFGIEEQRKTLLDELNSLTDTHAQAIARQRNALDESLRSTFDAIQAERTLAEERQKLVSLADTAYGAADRFLEPASARAFKLEVLAYKAQLAGAGASVGELVAAFEALSEEGIKTLVQQLLLAPDLSLDAKNAILGIGTSLLDMADAATAATRPIGELIEQLTGTRAGLATPQQALQAARDAYQRDLSLAMGGDADALGRITARATEYLDAQKAFSASSDITQTVIDRVIGDLSGLQGSVGSAYGGAGFIAGGGLVSTSASAAGVGAGTDMLAELRGLRAETAQLRTELATLREQQAQSTTFLAAANASSDQAAAQTIVDGLSNGQSRRQFAIGVATVNRN